MKVLFIFLFFSQIILVNSPIPNWNFDGQSISKSSYYKYTVYDKYAYDINVKLEKEIRIEDGVFSSKNILTVGSSTKEVPFEDIESHYANKYGVTGALICPKGKFHPYIFNDGTDFKADDFSIKKDWDLKCYDHNTDHFLIFYLPNEYYTFYSKCNNNCNENDNNIKRIAYVSDIYDYTLENGNNGINYKYRLPCLLKDGNDLKLSASALTMNWGDHNVNKQDPGGTNFITTAKTYTQACFDKDDSNKFYYFTYNDISDFNSGYYEISIDASNYNNGNGISITRSQQNNNSPFSFIDNTEIDEMKMIKGTKFVYYKIHNTDKNTYYYGLFDIKENKILYNFEQEQELNSFIPFSNDGQMIAVTSTSIYLVCIVKNGGSCDNSCSGISLDIEGNVCATGCVSDKIKLMPEEICINRDSCDLTSYIIKNVDGEDKCGLCSHFDPTTYKFKFIDGNECIDNKPNHAEFYNNEFFLLKCESNYHTVDNECVPDSCYDRCLTCSEYSEDINNQKCLSCKENYDQEGENCIIRPTPSTITPNPPTTITEKNPSTIIESPHSTTNEINIPTTVITQSPPITQIIDIPIAECKNKRCLGCTKQSDEVELCVSCDESLYKKVNYTINKYSRFFDCKSIDQLQTKFYYDEIKQQYKPCYKHCKTCSGPGNDTNQNCLDCEKNYMLRPGHNPYNNCVVYSEFYYLSAYNEYKPLQSPQCPEEAKYTIKDEMNKTSCIFDCKAHKDYKYLYNGNCFKTCDEIEGTKNENFKCKENDINKIYISENPLYLDSNDTLPSIQTLAIIYAQEFNYTVNHISLYKSDDMTIAFYKNISIIGNTNLHLPMIDFRESYGKIQSIFNISEDLIIAIVNKNVGGNHSTSYLFFSPESGLKLEVGRFFKDDTIEVKENLLFMLDENNKNYELQTALTKQGINIFDINDPYFKDICYDFDNPKNKDIALKDRVKETYANVELCDNNCVNTGIDIKNNIATCDCKFSEVINNNIIYENAALEYLVGELFDVINSSNILVLKCYKNILKYFTRSIGGMIVSILLILNICFTLIYCFYELTKMKRYIYDLNEKFISFIINYPHLAKFFPPKRKHKKNKTNDKINKNNLNDKILNDNSDIKEINFKRKTVNFSSNPKHQMNSNNLLIFKEKINEKEIITDKQQEKTMNELDKGKILKKYFKEYLTTSPDDMEYDEAIKLDKRSFCIYFLDSIKEKQSLAYTFISSDPINTRMIKFILFSLNINLYFVVNGLFFSEAFISELYHTEETKEKFFSFLPRTIDKIFYTTIVAIFIGYLTDFFFLDEKKVKGIFKREKDNKQILRRSITMLIKEIQKRYISFIIMTFVILLFSLYYVLCFNYVYPKTQMEWIKSSIFIIIIMQIISILKCLYETIFRFLSFKCESEKLYKMSKIFEKNM